MTAGEQLDSLARLRGGADDRLRAELCERFGLELDRPIRHLSKGNRQKVGLVQAFMHRPELVVLDEPSSGLDPLLQAEVRALLRETAADGRTVFLSSHSLDEVQHAADRVGIIRSGRLVDVDAVEHLRERALRHVTIVFAEPVDAARFEGLDGVRVDGSRGLGRAALRARARDGRDRQGGSRTPDRRPRLAARRPRGDLPRALRGAAECRLSSLAAGCSTTGGRSSAGASASSATRC